MRAMIRRRSWRGSVERQDGLFRYSLSRLLEQLDDFGETCMMCQLVGTRRFPRTGR